MCLHLLAGVGPVLVVQGFTGRPLEAVSLLESSGPDVINVVCGRRWRVLSGARREAGQGHEVQAGQVREYQYVAAGGQGARGKKGWLWPRLM